MDSARYAYAVIGIALIVGGCGGGGTVFALKDPTYAVKPTSVTVITGEPYFSVPSLSNVAKLVPA